MVRLAASLLLLAASLAHAQTAERPNLSQRIGDLLGRPAAQRTHWGVCVIDLDTGETLYQHGEDRLFIPASNVKLFSTAMALRRLGPDYAFTTSVVPEGSISESGRLDGDLRLIGGGDTNLSSRELPYRNSEDFARDRLGPLRQLAQGVKNAGIESIAGDVVGDDSRYVWQPYPRGWSHADTLLGYGSPTSALAFNDNLISLRVTPGAVGGPARVTIVPALGYYSISNRTLTASGRTVARGLQVRRGEAPGQIVLAGQIPGRPGGRTFELAADDPALYAAVALKQALVDLGVEVQGRAVAHHLLPDRLASLRSGPGSPASKRGEAVAELTSPPLSEVIRVVNKDSENLHAEMLLREVALHESGIATQEAAVQSLRRFLAEAGLRTNEFVLRDGSGLSRHDLLSPRGTVRLLEHMWESADRDAYLQSLPVAGLDGTLNWRFARTAARGRIRAKTGSMSHVLALSGYVSSHGGRTLAFAIFANNFGIAESSTRYLVDSIAAELVYPDPLPSGAGPEAAN